MILGVDHLALSFSGLTASVAAMESSGYTTKFIQKDFPNSPAKKAFLLSYRPLHTAVYCQIQKGVALELTDHGEMPHRGEYSYHVLMDHAPVDTLPFLGNSSFEAQAWKDALGVSQVAVSLWKPFDTPVWYTNTAKGRAAVRAVAVSVTDFERSKEFWIRGIGCSVLTKGVSEKHMWTRLSWRSPIPHWSLEIILLETMQKVGDSYLDASGFPCLAFLSNNLAEDRQRLLD